MHKPSFPLSILVVLLLAMLLPACGATQTAVSGQLQPGASPAPSAAGPTPVGEKAPNPVATNEPTMTAEPEPSPSPVNDEPGLVGPETYPPGINPLSGLPVSKPQNLLMPPALVSITNFPKSARPQAGLSFSPFVFELYIGEGMSRFLALFYGDFPGEAPSLDGDDTLTSADSEIGPIRSGRLPYEHVRGLYNGFLVMASAYSGVAQNLGDFTNIYGSDGDNINSAMIKVTRLEQIAAGQEALADPAAMQGTTFDSTLPAGGVPAQHLWYIYNVLNQIEWRYDPADGAYHRYQDQADGITFVEASDKLTGEALTYENVIILFANHRACNEVAFDVDMTYIQRSPAYILRDGALYKVYWTTIAEAYEKTTGKLRPIRFIDANGDPFPLKPGQTWVHITPLNTPVWEAMDSSRLYDLLNNQEPGSGNWVTRFHSSSMIEDKTVCDAIR
ncbi:MAG: DUF3048 domain-containing protein [Anaerolineae bacterium]|nr:DUF3048 domain-containing protein [Anaerolineae bacterium]